MEQGEEKIQVMLSVDNSEVTITLDVYPSTTLQQFRSAIEAKGFPALSQHIYKNGQLLTDESKTLQQLNIVDGDMLALRIRDMWGSTGVPQGASTAASAQQQSHRAAGAGSAMAQDPEVIRLQFLGDPRLRSEVERMNPQLAAAIDNPQQFAQIFRSTADRQEDARRARIREIEALNNDEFNPEAQARIAEMIRQERVMENLQNAMEYNPESFGRVHLLYCDVKVNGVKVKALVDSGAQATIMSPSCAEACNIMHLVDRRFAGVARGVGTANIIGRVHYTMLQVGTKHLPAAFTVMEGKAVDLLLGLDILKGHQATIDLMRNKLIIQGEEVDFLGESEIPKETEDAVTQEPTVQGPGGTTIGARSGAITSPSSGPQAAATVPSRAAPPATGPSQPAAAPGLPPRAQPSQPQPQRAFPENDINTLMGLGVDRQTAINALEATGGNVEYAASLLFQN